MSLSALNYPPLVALSGVGLGISLPILEKLTQESPWTAVRLACAISYGINFISVSRPGRMDGQASDGDYENGDSNSELAQLSPRRGKTLVAPSGWAFAIWGPIFLGELISVTSAFFLKDNNSSKDIISTLRKTSGPFIAAQLFQSLWCAAFRPKYKGLAMFINTGLLSATAYSLSKAHAVFAAQPNLYTNLQYGLFLLPMSLHFGWTVAASIVSLNGAISMQDNSSPKLIAYVGHASVIAASALGVYITVMRSAPVFGSVIAWALTAVADGMKQRIAAAANENGENKPLQRRRKNNSSDNNNGEGMLGLYGASTQRALALGGAVINAATTVFIAGSMAFGTTISGWKSVPSF